MARPLKVLLVEDNPTDAELIVRMLERAGFDLDWTRVDDEPAFLAGLKPDLDLILSDFELPQFNGLRALELLNARALQIPFIIISGAIGEGYAVEALHGGAADYLLKDRLTRLPLAVERALEQQRMRRDQQALHRTLRESEEQYRTLVTASPDAIVVISLEGVIRFASPRARELFVFAAEAVVNGRNVLEFLPPAERARAQTNIRLIVTEGRIGANEYTLLRRDGTTFRGEINAALMHDGRGVATGIVLVTRDVTERGRAEAALRDSEARFSTVFHASPVGTALSQYPSGRFVDLNAAFAQITGYGRDELIGRTSFEIELWVDQPQRVLVAAEIAASGRRQNIESQIRRKGGTIADVLVSAEMIELNGEKFLLGMVTDITQAKQAERTLRESEERFRQVVESIHEVFWMTDSGTGRIIYVSPGFERIWGHACADLYAQADLWRNSLHPEDRDRVLRAVREKQPAGTYDETYRIVRPDGTTRWIRDQAFPVRSPGGEVSRVVGVAEDISEQKTMESQFLRAQRLESIGTLASGIAHDLNNILAPILMSAPLLRWKLPPKEVEQVLTSIEESARRGAELVRQLLTFSRGVEGERGVLRLDPLLREMAKIAQQTFSKNIRVAVAAAPDLWPVVADPTQVHQLLLNLCVNARDAMPEGGVLTIGAENVVLDAGFAAMQPGARMGSHVLIRISDTGAGIPPGIVDKIFDPFFTTKPLGKGTGLGLATVAGIVKSHGGFLNLRSEVGQGTTFLVYLPAAPGAEEPTEEAAQLPAPRGSGEVLLVVEDEANIREVVRETLTRHGYEVITADDGADATAQFARLKGRVQAVITDLDMPVMDGMAMIHVLKRISPDVRVLVSSGLASSGRLEARRVELRALGINEILVKPYAAAELLRAVHALVQRGGE